MPASNAAALIVLGLFDTYMVCIHLPMLAMEIWA